MIPRSGPLSRAFVTLRFERHPSSRGGHELPQAMELHPELPIPSVGETLAVAEDGTASRFEVMAKHLDYRSNSRCIVTLSVAESMETPT